MRIHMPTGCFPIDLIVLDVSRRRRYRILESLLGGSRGIFFYVIVRPPIDVVCDNPRACRPLGVLRLIGVRQIECSRVHPLVAGTSEGMVHVSYTQNMKGTAKSCSCRV